MKFYKSQILNSTLIKLQEFTSYPRIDSTTIIAVITPDGKKLLPGRNLKYSTLHKICVKKKILAFENETPFSGTSSAKYTFTFKCYNEI